MRTIRPAFADLGALSFLLRLFKRILRGGRRTVVNGLTCRPTPGLPLLVCLLCFCCNAAFSFGESLSSYTYTPWGTTWADDFYAQDRNLGLEVDSGSCSGPHPIVQKNIFAYSSGVSEDVSQERIRLLTDGKGHWIPSSAVFRGTPSLYPLSGSISWFLNLASSDESSYSMSVSSSGQLNVIETGSTNLQANWLFYVTAGTMYWTSKESIDLNTGDDAWQFEIHATGSGSGGCTFSAELYASSNFRIDIELSRARPPVGNLWFANPLESHVGQVLPLPATVSQSEAETAPGAGALSADGRSAAVVVYQSPSSTAVTFSLFGLGLPKGTTGIGVLTAYQPTYLADPSPGKSIEGVAQEPVNEGCGGAGPPCIFLALLWPPAGMPYQSTQLENLNAQAVTLAVEAVQGSVIGAETIVLQPPPVVLVHGIWSDAAAAWGTFQPWLTARYPNGGLVFTADYGKYNSITFESQPTQQVLSLAISDALNYAAAQDTVATSVDVVGHSMGGLATRYFMDHGPPAPFVKGYFPATVVHKLITIGTPSSGSALATFLWANRPTVETGDNIIVDGFCKYYYFRKCTVAELFTKLDKPIDTAVESLQNGYSSSKPYRAIQGLRPVSSGTETLLNSLINGFRPGKNVDGILGTNYNDTIVGGPSQVVGSRDKSCIPDVVHTALPATGDVGETASLDVWNQALYWLMGGQGQYYSPTGSAPACAGSAAGADGSGSLEVPRPEAQSAPPVPFFDLTGYTEVAASNVTIAPASGSTLIAGVTAAIEARSSTKTLTELLLFQNVTDPSDALVYDATENPFNVYYTASRLGTASFTAYAVFSDQTFAVVPLNYTLAPLGAALALSLSAPTAAIPAGVSVNVSVGALFAGGFVDVTDSATYRAKSGGNHVISIGSDGAITATGKGTDTLEVSYGGLTGSAQIVVTAPEEP